MPIKKLCFKLDTSIVVVFDDLKNIYDTMSEFMKLSDYDISQHLEQDVMDVKNSCEVKRTSTYMLASHIVWLTNKLLGIMQNFLVKNKNALYPIFKFIQRKENFEVLQFSTLLSQNYCNASALTSFIMNASEYLGVKLAVNIKDAFIHTKYPIRLVFRFYNKYDKEDSTIPIRFNSSGRYNSIINNDRHLEFNDEKWEILHLSFQHENWNIDLSN
jgi:hypothetical protein